MKIVIAAATDVGTVRETNEDFFYYSKPSKLIVVCDGMGGHQSGAVASRIAGKTLRDVFFHADFAELARLGEDLIDHLPPLALRLVIGVRLANRRLRLMAERDSALRGMGTTVVALALGETNGCVVHVGDSRLYQLRQKKLIQITEDHSLVNQLLQDHDIREDEVKHFRKKNVLTRALGTHPTLKVDVQWFPVQTADMFLLCSDGFHNALNHEEIEARLNRREPDLQKMVDGLVQRAKKANGSDNITLALVNVEKAAPPQSGDKKDKEKVKLTTAEESEKGLQFEDNFIKEKYLIGKSSSRRSGVKSKRHWWSLFSILGVLVLTALVYGMISQKWPFDTAPPKQETSLLIASSGIPSSTDLVQANSPVPAVTAPPIGGYLVFLHLNNLRQLDAALRGQLAGVRVLDQFNPSETMQTRQRMLSHPIPPGNYSFVIVDSLQKLVYRRDGIRLRARPAFADTIRPAEAASALPVSPSVQNQTTAAVPPRAAADTSQRPVRDTLDQQDRPNQ